MEILKGTRRGMVCAPGTRLSLRPLLLLLPLPLLLVVGVVEIVEVVVVVLALLARRVSWVELSV